MIANVALRRTVTSLVDGGGVAIAAIGPTRPHSVWMVSRIAVFSDSDGETTCTISVDGHVLEGTYGGNRDASDYPIPLTLHPGSRITAQWANGTPGKQGTLNVHGEEFYR